MEVEKEKYKFSHLLHGGGKWKIQLPTSAIWRWMMEDTTFKICYMEVEEGRYNFQDLLYGGGRRKIQIPRNKLVSRFLLEKHTSVTEKVFCH